MGGIPEGTHSPTTFHQQDSEIGVLEVHHPVRTHKRLYKRTPYQKDSGIGIQETNMTNLNQVRNSSQVKPITTTPLIKDVTKPKTRLFHNSTTEKVEMEIIPTETDLEFLLVNSCAINVIKVQTIVENFIRDKKHTSIFCLTETKIDSHDFEPRGIKMFSIHRTKKEKKGGGLAIGYDKDADIKLEQIKIKNNDILALEGTILNTKIRIILCYFDNTKLKSGTDFNRNRRLQNEVE